MKSGKNHSFLPCIRTSYMQATFYILSNKAVSGDSIYHLKPYAEQLLRTCLAAVKNTHSCTDMGCLATPLTWRVLKLLIQLLLSNLVELQRFLDQERGNTPLSKPQAHLLSDFKAVTKHVESYEKATASQASIQSSHTAAREAEEAYKQARSMERYSPKYQTPNCTVT